MFNPRFLFVVAAAGLLVACTRPADDASKTTDAAKVEKKAVATVNGKQLSGQLFDTFLHAVTGGSKEPPTDEHAGATAGPADQHVARRAGGREGRAGEGPRGPGAPRAAAHADPRRKQPWLAMSRSAAELDLMRRIKSELDPNGILNPGRVLPD